MIMLFFLTEKFPLLASNDDTEALMEIAAIIGRKRMEKTATLHSTPFPIHLIRKQCLTSFSGRLFQSNVPSITMDGISWAEFVERQNPNLRQPRAPVPHYYPYSMTPQRQRTHPPSSSSPNTRYSASLSPPPELQPPDQIAHEEDIKNALDLVEQLMHPECVKRITPRKALYHPFLHDPDDPGDDEFYPHPFGLGICRKHHFRDSVTEELSVEVKVPGCDKMERRCVQAGEGIAIGREPCEFHRNIDFEVGEEP